jgi:hypothetical protein
VVEHAVGSLANMAEDDDARTEIIEANGDWP